MRQYVYLVCKSYDEQTTPVKCFLQKLDAIKYGRKLATQEQDDNISYELYRQEMTRTATFEFVKTLTPYNTSTPKPSVVVEPFDWSNVPLQ